MCLFKKNMHLWCRLYQWSIFNLDQKHEQYSWEFRKSNPFSLLIPNCTCVSLVIHHCISVKALLETAVSCAVSGEPSLSFDLTQCRRRQIQNSGLCRKFKVATAFSSKRGQCSYPRCCKRRPYTWKSPKKFTFSKSQFFDGFCNLKILFFIKLKVSKSHSSQKFTF